MTTNLLLDTNVIIDYLGRREPFFADARNVIASGYFGDTRLWMSAQSAKDAYCVLCHYAPSSSVQDALLALYEVVAPVAITEENLRRAARLKWDDYEDCLIALAAEDASADYLVTRDARGFARSSAPPISPGAWLSLHERETGIVYDEADW